MSSKAEIFNFALSALLLQRQIIDPENDKSNESKVLKTQWASALKASLVDMNLDATTKYESLELLVENPTDIDNWVYVYKYPQECALLRRIRSMADKDDRSTHIDKLIRLYTYQEQTQKVIMTNEQEAVVEYIPDDIPLSTLSPLAAQCIAHRLAWQSAPLIVGKGARTLRNSIFQTYQTLKIEAQVHDRNEGFSHTPEYIDSEFVRERLS